ncbi:gliding motility-associated peptidyl-prolyl isomerase GldI [Hanstruepera marina]|uniref:gliding motility-associated peptidyl-prolyl isomerase GldI n=1 Tax=Hanstruepera marina TaxID=2873265 RepID=UPI001CA707F0|nr:gliding motility-associated peptidyl-prolyl isomerase GldI [Hanstruepera marina]
MKPLTYIILLLLVFTACKSPEARRPISAKSGSFIDKSVARNIQLNEREELMFQDLMEADTTKNYEASENGFWYSFKNRVSDSLITPSFGDTVVFDYNVKTSNGEIIYSKGDLKTQRYIMDKQELFSGLREGLKLMRAGESATFLFPSQKAYGYYGDENKIGTNVPIICDVTVHTINPNK